jgi:hypothetical protein
MKQFDKQNDIKDKNQLNLVDKQIYIKNVELFSKITH